MPSTPELEALEARIYNLERWALGVDAADALRAGLPLPTPNPTQLLQDVCARQQGYTGNESEWPGAASVPLSMIMSVALAAGVSFDTGEDS